MQSNFNRLFFIISASLCSAICSAIQYSFSEIASPTNTYYVGYSINNSGEVFGLQKGVYVSGVKGMVYSGGTLKDIGSLGGSFCTADAISNTGYLAGSAYVSGSAISQQHAFRYKNGVITDLGVLGGSWSQPRGVNDYGVVVGESNTSSGEVHAFMATNGVMTDLGVLGGQTSRAYAINNAGQIVGTTTSTAAYDSFIYENGKMQSFGAGGFTSSATDINDLGQIVGYSDHFGAMVQGYVYTPGSGITYLGSLGYSASYCSGINNSGTVIGYSMKGSVFHGFVYENSQLIDLNNVTAGLTGSWYVETCLGINDQGQILAWLNDTDTHTYRKTVILTPQSVPEPATIVSIGIGLAAIVRKGRRHSGKRRQ